MTLAASDYLLLRVTGNKAVVSLKTSGAGRIAGVCVFGAGNQSKVNLELGLDLGKLIYFGTGNQHQGTVRVAEEKSIDAIEVKLRGNKAKLSITGSGSYNCDIVDLDINGSGPSFTCGD